ncbi:MAG: porin family protein [bacterium]|nr:MAG: porin family protein [bacterium]
MRVNILVLVFTLFAALLLVNPALAGAGAYFGASVGSGSIDFDIPGVGTFDDSDTAFKIFAGYKLVGFFVEGAYVDFGAPSETIGVDTGEFDVIALVAQGGYSFGLGPLDVFGKAGMAFWDSETNVNGIPVDDESDSDLIYGVGAAVSLAGFGVRAEYEIIDVDEADVEMYSVGIVFNF